MNYPAVILAGGRSSRMGGGDKCLVPLNGRPMLAHVLERLSNQAAAILICSNSAPELFRRFRLPVLPDAVPGFQGPLAGLLTGMLWARRHHPRAPYILSLSCDTPFLPPDLAARLSENLSLGSADVAIARDPERLHPAIGLWPVDLAERLAFDLEERGIRSIRLWLSQFRVRETLFATHHLKNINTRDDLADAETSFQPACQANGRLRWAV
jgi:molybdopterin-guanine dinucleotide biosynthesis protein A